MHAGNLAVLTLLSVAPVSAFIPAALAAEQKAVTAQKQAFAPSTYAAQRVALIPAELLVPVAHFPAELMAPSAADWMMYPTPAAPAGQRLAVWTPPAAEPKVLAIPLPEKNYEIRKALASASIPLPLRRPEFSTPDVRPVPTGGRITATQAPPNIEALIQRYAERFDIPATLVRRMAWRESKFDPKQRNGPYWGLLQIRVDTARSLGFRGEPADLLDADTNMTYAVAYLANAYKVSGRNEKRAEMLYARGYYYEAKRKGMLGTLIKTASVDE